MATITQVVLVVEYDGTHYHGFQLQADLPTIQGEIERALLKLTGEVIRVMSASRTDAGVHAKGQVVSFRSTSSLPLEAFVNGLNYYLARNIAVKTAYRVDDSFNVRRDAVSRQYRYCVLNSPTRSPTRERFSYRVSGQLDIEAMNQACQVLVGKHDFIAFASSIEDKTKSTVRKVYRVEIEKNRDLAVFNMVASSFLTHQVRNTIGTLIRVGLDKMKINDFCSIIETKRLGLVGPAAPACGLCLVRVSYPGTFSEEG